MKPAIITSFILLLLLSLRPVDNKYDCAHCGYINKIEPTYHQDPRQPKEYIHTDSMFSIQPIIDNIDEPIKDRYIQEFRLTYKDKHYCSDSTKLTLYFDRDSITLWNVRPRMSCKITMWYRVNIDQQRIMSTKILKTIKIENRVTDNIYMYNMNDENYFIKTFKLLK